MASREPFSRHRHRADGNPERALLAAYEFAAYEYHWSPQEVEERLSDEQLVAYFDAGFDRRSSDAEIRFAEMVEAVRAGYGFAHDQKAYSRWRVGVDRKHRPAETHDLASFIAASGGSKPGKSVLSN